MRNMIFALALMALGAGCGDDGGHPQQDAPPSVHDAGVDAPADAACFTNPQTHKEIINACTTAQQIFKDSHPPLTQPDGSLPQLPP